MRILIDTNVLFSAILHEDSKVARALFYANEHHEIYLSDQNIRELRRIVEKKVPRKLNDIEVLLAKLAYEVIPAVDMEDVDVGIRDVKDKPILNAAIINDLDLIITGDKDFLVLGIERPRCVNVAEFCEMEGVAV